LRRKIAILQNKEKGAHCKKGCPIGTAQKKIKILTKNYKPICIPIFKPMLLNGMNTGP
jgi:ABC-type cobalt transport system substrate-binding protein